MYIRKTYVLLLLLMSFFCVGAQAQTKWMNPMDADEPYVGGRAWNSETGRTYNRLPDRFRATLPPAVWALSQNTAGEVVRFVTPSRNITVRYACTSHGYGLYNMSGICHSGVDLYGKTVDGRTLWIGNHMQWSFRRDTVTVSFNDIAVPSERGLEYTLYLPGYNGVKWLEVGVDSGASFKFLHQSPERPVVVYGSSIIQGASPSRPGMAITNIVEREMEYPVINLGFSGSCLMERPVFDMMAQIDARAFIIDPIPNSYSLPDTAIIARAVQGVRLLRSKSAAPILLCENHPQPDSLLRAQLAQTYRRANAALRRAYLELVAQGVPHLYYMHSSDIHFADDYMIEGTHPNDLGCRAYADAYERKLREMLPEDAPDPRYPPVTQRRDGVYEWRERHNEVVRLNHTTNPEILMIGNSITNFWGGRPVCQNNGGDTWQKLFGKRRVTNMGFGWDRIENVYWRIFHGELEGCAPKHICLLIGINNSDDAADDIAAGVSRLVRLIRQRQPGARLHVLKLLPARGREQKVALVNSLIDKYVSLDAHTDIVDMTADLTLCDGSGKIDPKFFLGDGLHPNATGYGVMAKRLAKLLK